MRLKEVQLLKLNSVTLESGCIRAKKEKEEEKKAPERVKKEKEEGKKGSRKGEERKGGGEKRLQKGRRKKRRR